MIKKIFTYLSLVIVAITCSVTHSSASHIVGMDLTYTYTGTTNEYVVTMKFYRDCYGIGAPNSVTICYQTVSQGQQGTATLPLTSGPTQIPTNPCLPPQGPTTCQGGSAYGVEEYVYSATIQLPVAAVDWKFTYTDCCRNQAITTLQNGAGEGIYAEALLDNLNYPTNSSPYFNQIPVTQFCVCNLFFFDNKAVDIDGDGLHYYLVNCESGGGQCNPTHQSVVYLPGFSGIAPVTVCTGAAPTTIGFTDGVVVMTPGQPEVAVICILVEDIDSLTGNVKGHVRRDLQIDISGACIIQNPQIISGTVQTPNGPVTDAVVAYCQDTSVIVPLSEQVQCGSIAANGSDFRALRPNGSPNPIFKAVPLNCQSGVTDSVIVYFYKPLTHGVTKLWTKLGTDGNTMLTDCGSPLPEYDTLNVVVVDSSDDVLSVLDTAACVFNELVIDLPLDIWCYAIAADGSDFVLMDASGNTYPLASASGTNCSPFVDYTNQVTVTTAVAVNGATPPLYLTLKNGTDLNTISNACDKFFPINDTVAIIWIGDKIPVTVPDVTQCASDPAPVLSAGNLGTSVNYQWYFNGTLLPDTTSSITATQAGQYILILGTGPTCNGSDTIDVVFIASPADPNLPNPTICTGDPFPVLNALNTGSTYIWSTGETTQTITPTSAGTYVVTISNGNCNTTATSTVTVQNGLLVTLGLDQTICQAPITIDAGNPGNTYNWSNGATTQTINAVLPGTYNVIVTSPSGCTGNDTIVITAGNFPSTITGKNLVCYDETATNFIDCGVTGPATYSWSTGGTNQTLNVTQTGIYTVSITNQYGCTSTASFSVTVDSVGVPVLVCSPSTDGSGNFVYSWSPVFGATSYEYSLTGDAGSFVPVSPNATDTFQLITPPAPSNFVVLAIGAACTGKTSEPAFCEVIIPNIVTPNGDGKNDLFHIKNLEQFDNAKLEIFNRWGNKVYSSDGYKNDYGFTDQPDGVYYYVLTVPTHEPYHGTITVLDKK